MRAELNREPRITHAVCSSSSSSSSRVQRPHSPLIGNGAGVGCSVQQHECSSTKTAAATATGVQQPKCCCSPAAGATAAPECSTPTAPRLVTGPGCCCSVRWLRTATGLMQELQHQLQCDCTRLQTTADDCSMLPMTTAERNRLQVNGCGPRAVGRGGHPP